MWTEQFKIVEEKTKKLLADRQQSFSFSKAEQALGASNGKWNAWSRGQRPSADDLARIATTLGLSAQWLLLDEGPATTSPEDAVHCQDFEPVGDNLRAILNDHNLNTTQENFARVGEISVEELTAILENRLPLPVHTARKWVQTYRINANYLAAGVGMPLLTREQYEQNGHTEYPRGCGNPDYAEPIPQQEKSIASTIQDAPAPDTTQSDEIPVLGLAQCGLTGWATTIAMAMSVGAPPLRKGMVAAVAIGDSMLRAGIQPGNIVYCDPDLAPQKNEPVLVRRSGVDAQTEGDATLKLWEGRDDSWIYLRGWLPQKEGQQKEFSIKQSAKQVVMIAPVTLIRRRV